MHSAHSCDIIHGNISKANIFVKKQRTFGKENKFIKLANFNSSQTTETITQQHESNKKDLEGLVEVFGWIKKFSNKSTAKKADDF